MKLDIKPIVLQCRLYQQENYTEESPFTGVFTVQLIEDRAYISAAHGMSNFSSIINQLRDCLRIQKIKKVYWYTLEGREVELSI